MKCPYHHFTMSIPWWHITASWIIKVFLQTTLLHFLPLFRTVSVFCFSFKLVQWKEILYEKVVYHLSPFGPSSMVTYEVPITDVKYSFFTLFGSWYAQTRNSSECCRSRCVKTYLKQNKRSLQIQFFSRNHWNFREQRKKNKDFLFHN